VRFSLACTCVATVIVASGCGGEDEPRAAKTPPPVQLSITTPADTSSVQAESVEVRGTVAPKNAAVQVMGRDATVSDGAFSAEVSLSPGANVIDVMATARNRRAAMTAVRVGREVPVEVPDLDGLSVEEAEGRIADAGLELEVERGGGLLEDILPGEPAVCEQEPEAGTEVRRGTTVRAVAAKSC
jgi:Glucodextranase, domain B/PASTA domain